MSLQEISDSAVTGFVCVFFILQHMDYILSSPVVTYISSSKKLVKKLYYFGD